LKFKVCFACLREGLPCGMKAGFSIVELRILQSAELVWNIPDGVAVHAAS
jgi:hypothetical protein